MRNIYLLAAICWTLLIAYLCLIKGSSFSSFEIISISQKDKYVHFAFYFFFTILWYKHFIQSNVNSVKAKWLVFGTALLYGICIEFLQGSIAALGRSPDAYDVLANTAGSLAGLLILKLFEKKTK